MKGSALFLVVALTALGCAGAQHPGQGNGDRSGTAGKGNFTEVRDEDLGPRVRELLLTAPRDPARKPLLTGVVRRLFAQATARFKSGRTQSGLARVRGAFYLMRTGDLEPEMLEGAVDALRSAAQQVAREGKEGRAFALYRMLERLVPKGKEQEEVRAHLAALELWGRAEAGKPRLVVAGAEQRATVGRALLEPTREALALATAQTIDWIAIALDAQMKESITTRDEAIEARRALRTGAATLIGLYLRHRDAEGAIAALDAKGLGQVVSPDLRRRLEQAARGEEPEAWVDLHQLFRNASEQSHGQMGIDADLAHSAAWGAAIELYRRTPEVFEGVAPLVTLLTGLGLDEAVPELLNATLKTLSTRQLAWALEQVRQAMIDEGEAEALPAVRRLWQRSAGLVAAARARKSTRERPTPGDVAFTAAVLETRAGELDRARILLDASINEEPSPAALLLLANIHRQAGRIAEARVALERTLGLAKTRGEVLLEVEVLVSRFEVELDAGNESAAKSLLGTALARALDARQLARDPANLARAERSLARVLESYGDLSGAQRATRRAFEASRSNALLLSAVVQDAARRALTHSDLRAGREAVRQAIDARLTDDELVYSAIWLRLLEKGTGTTTDGTVEEALSMADGAAGWVKRLRQWGRGQIGDGALLAGARSPAERTEAGFYTALGASNFAAPKDRLEKLRLIAQSPTIQLVEVRIARDLLARAKSRGFALPAGVRVP